LKKLLAILLLFPLLAPSADSQIIIGKRAMARHDYAKAKNNGWEIVIDPIEVVPERKISMRRMSTQVATNWGRDLLLPNDIRQRLIAECKYPVVVKVGDTGDPNHDYLRTGHLSPANYTSDPSVADGHGHSTHVCGIIAANELGLAEALVQKGLLQFKACKVLSNSGSGSFQWVADMFTREYSNDTSLLRIGTYVVYNMSLGGGTAKNSAVEAAMKKSTDAGVFIAVANGNTGGAGVQYPGNSVYVIGTASLDQNPLQRSSYSTYGPETMVAMPGRSINSTYKDNSFALLSGTSMATPFTTAAIAIARSKWGPKLKSVDHLRSYLQACATDIPPTGRDEYTGWGIEYIKRILDQDPDSIGHTPPPPPPPIDPDSLKREARVLSVPLRGEWKIVYNPTIATQRTKNGGWWIFKKTVPIGPRIVTDSDFSTFVGTQSTDVITVTAIDVEIKTQYYLPFTHKLLVETTNKFFTNRGLSFSGPTDLVDGLKYTAYFYDMIAYLQLGKVDLNVLRIDGKDSKGRFVYLDGTKLLRYTPK
jgi:hypothetical protein